MRNSAWSLQLSAKPPIKLLAAREHAQIVIDQSRPLAEAVLSQVDARLQWAQAKLIMGNFDAVDTILARGRKAISDPRYQDVYLQLQLKKAKSTPDSDQTIDALERILASPRKICRPNHRPLSQSGERSQSSTTCLSTPFRLSLPPGKLTSSSQDQREWAPTVSSGSQSQKQSRLGTRPPKLTRSPPRP